jgi:hypothetical protein
VIMMETDKGSVMIAEAYPNMDKLLSGKELKELLENVRVFISPDKKHIAYYRYMNKKDTAIIFHFLEDSIPFFEGVADVDLKKKMEDKKEPDWKQISSPEQIASPMLGDTSIRMEEATALWNAVAALKPENPLDYQALSNWDKSYYAKQFIEQRCNTWKKSSDKWKTEVRAMFEKHFSLYTDIYMQKQDVQEEMKSLCSLAHIIQDNNLILKCEQVLAIGIPYSGVLADLFKDEYKLNHSDSNTVQICENMIKYLDENAALLFRKRESTITADKFLKVAYSIYDSILISRCMSIMAKNWPPDSIARTSIDVFYEDIPKKDVRQIKEKAFKELKGKYADDAKHLLENTSDSLELKKYSRQYKIDFKYPLYR